MSSDDKNLYSSVFICVHLCTLGFAELRRAGRRSAYICGSKSHMKFTDKLLAHPITTRIERYRLSLSSFHYCANDLQGIRGRTGTSV